MACVAGTALILKVAAPAFIGGVRSAVDERSQAESAVVPGISARRKQAVAGLQEVVDLYINSTGAVFDALWHARSDAHLAKREPEELLDWLEDREKLLSEPGASEALLAYPTWRFVDLARVTHVLAAKDKSSKRQLFRERHKVLQDAMAVMVRFGVGPAGGIAPHVRQLAEDYPGQETTVGLLYVDYFRGITSIAERATDSYAQALRIADSKAFRDRVVREARAVEFERLKKLYKNCGGSRTADLSAIYLVAHYWRRGPGERQEARRLVAQHRARWDSDPQLRERASREIGDVMASLDGLKALVFVDSGGTVWQAADLRGRTSIFCFAGPGERDSPQFYQSRFGDKVLVIAVPMIGDRLVGGGFVSVDPNATDVSKLLSVFHIRGTGIALVTPALEVIGDDRAIEDYLASHFGQSLQDSGDSHP